jgi:hypothetical protein
MDNFSSTQFSPDHPLTSASFRGKKVSRKGLKNLDGPAKRIRATKACDICSLKRSKCSGNSDGCTKCAELGLSCAYTRSVKKRGPPKKSVTESMAAKARAVLSSSSTPHDHTSSASDSPLPSVSLSAASLSSEYKGNTVEFTGSLPSPSWYLDSYPISQQSSSIDNTPLQPDLLPYFPADCIFSSDMKSLDGISSYHKFLPQYTQSTTYLPFPYHQSTSESIAQLYSVSMMHQWPESSSFMPFSGNIFEPMTN